MDAEERDGLGAGPRALILTILIIGGLFALLFWRGDKYGLERGGQPALEVGLPAPEFALPDLEGNQRSLSDYRGRVILLNIWATWCPPCVDEMPSMQALYEALGSEGLEILAVSIDVNGSKAVAPFAEKYGLTFPLLLDPDSRVAAAYGTTGVPESFIIDREGRLARKVIGGVDWISPAVVGFIRGLVDGKSS